MTDQQQRWGAYPEDWLHFDLVLGLGADLLPVVSNPGATISPDSKMKALGKTPSVYNRNRHAVGIPQWTSHQTAVDDIDKWTAEPDYGICIQTREVRAIDIDVEDQDKADAILRAAIKHIPGAVRYREGTGKCLLGFRTPGEISKRSFKCDGGLVEFLATGQQFVAAGTHPSGSRYQWDGGPPDFPEVPLEVFEAAWADLIKQFATEEVRNEQPTKTKAQALSEAVASDPVVEALSARGLVLSSEKDGRLHITCPFADDHTTDSAESATSYFPAHTGGYERGHFHCLHAHCSDRSDNDFLTALGLGHDPRDDFTATDELGEAIAAAADGRPSKFELQSHREFAGGKPLQWYVKGVIPKAELVVVYGPPGSGKSFWTTDLVLAIARGLDRWRDHRVHPARVAYVAAEGAPGFRNRLESYCIEHEIPNGDLPIFVVPAAPNLAERQDVIDLGNAILRKGGIDILVVDTLARASIGADENSAKDMGVVLGNCKTLHEVTGATIVLVHHSGKDPAKGARGSNAVLGAADAEIEIVRDGERRVATVTKMKDGEDGATFGFKLKVVQLGMDEDGDVITSCVVEQTDTPVIVKRERKMGANEGRVWQAILDLQGIGQTAPGVETVITQAVEMTPFDPASGKRDNRRAHMLRSLDALVSHGKIEIKNGAVLLAGGAE